MIERFKQLKNTLKKKKYPFKMDMFTVIRSSHYFEPNMLDMLNIQRYVECIYSGNKKV